MKPVRTVARGLLAAIFVRSGWDAFNNPDRHVDTAKSMTDRLAPTLDAVGLPTDTRTLVRLNGAAQMAGGVLLATGTAVRPAALTLIGSLIPTTVAGHDFWAADDPGQKATHRVQFMKNLGLIGGLLLAAVDTEGRPGLAWRTGHLADHAQDSIRRTARTTAKEARRAAHRTAREAEHAQDSIRRTARTTAKETRRAAHVTAKEARRAARTAARETKLAVRSAKAGSLIPG
jgi:putative oxidoreductase